MITTAEKLRCAERELNYRQRVYPRLVARGTMTQRLADYEIGVMEEIAADYRALDEARESLLALMNNKREDHA